MAVRFFLAFSFLLITILSIAQPENPFCDESVSISQGSVANQMTCMTSESPNNDHQQDHDHHTSCHNCHIGHCLFTLTGASNFKFYISSESYIFVSQKMTLSNFKAQIDRPPIG